MPQKPPRSPTTPSASGIPDRLPKTSGMTLTEAGVNTADVDLRFWFVIFAPAGIPRVVKAKLDKAVSTTLSNPLVRERLANLDIEPGYAPGNVMKKKLENEKMMRLYREHVLGEKKPEGGFVPLDGLLASSAKPVETEEPEEVGAMGD